MAKILVVSNFITPPVMAGSTKCVESYTKLLKDLGHEVYYLYSGREHPQRIESAKEYWGDYFLYYKYSQLLRTANWVKRHLLNLLQRKYTIGYYYPLYGLASFVNRINKQEHFDAIIVNYIWMSRLLTKVSIKNKILFTHDSFTNKRERIKQELYSLTAHQESIGLKRANKILSIQEDESILFRYLVPNVPVYTIYMPIPFKETLSNENKNILFFSGDSDINRNGIQYFLNDIFPSLLAVDSDIQLLIAGGICKSLTVENKNIKMLGYIKDIDAFYSLGNVAINPVYQGTGLKIKTLEALSYGKITIVHPHSVEGLYKKDNSPVIVAHNPQEYITHIINSVQGKIDKLQYTEKCKDYINEMNEYIRTQYSLIKFD